MGHVLRVSSISRRHNLFSTSHSHRRPMMSGDVSRDLGINGRAAFEPRAWLQRPHSSCDPILSTPSPVSLRAGQAGDSTQGASAGAAAVLGTQWCPERLRLRMPTGLGATPASGTCWGWAASRPA